MARTSVRRLPWNDAQRTRLIKLAKQHEILWRPGANDVEALKRRRMALGQVHRHFVADGFSLDDVKMQWRNLKDIFYKRYELMIKKAQNGEEPSRIRPNWTHFEELRFLASQRAIGEGRTRRTLTYGSIDDVERRIEQGEAEMLEREGGGEEEVEEMGDWMGEEGAEMDNQHQQQQGMQMEHVLVKLEGAGAVNEGQQQTQRPKQQEFKDFAGIHQEIDDNFRQLLDESPMGRLSRSIDHRIQQRQHFDRKHNLAIFDGQEQNGVGGIHHSQFGPSTSSSSAAAIHLLAESPSAIIDFQQQNPPFVGKSEGQKKKFALNNGAFVGQRQNMNNHLDEKKDRFKYFGSYVESALRDLSQQSPELARRLQQSIYSTISAHQMEATNAFD